jgi:hypothetical protein
MTTLPLHNFCTYIAHISYLSFGRQRSVQNTSRKVAELVEMLPVKQGGVD